MNAEKEGLGRIRRRCRNEEPFQKTYLFHGKEQRATFHVASTSIETLVLLTDDFSLVLSNAMRNRFSVYRFFPADDFSSGILDTEKREFVSSSERLSAGGKSLLRQSSATSIGKLNVDVGVE